MATSPKVSPKKVEEDERKLLSFLSAIKELMEGKNITRVEWNNPNNYGTYRNYKVQIKLDNGFHDWIITDGDLFATDWYVV